MEGVLGPLNWGLIVIVCLAIPIAAYNLLKRSSHGIADENGRVKNPILWRCRLTTYRTQSRTFGRLVGPLYAPISVAVRAGTIEIGLFPGSARYLPMNLNFIAEKSRIEVVWCQGLFRPEVVTGPRANVGTSTASEFIQITGPYWPRGPFSKEIQTWLIRRNGRMRELWDALVYVGANPESSPPTEACGTT